MTEIPANHPRFRSLTIRNRLVDGFHKGLASEAGLLAHGRGEAFDYLIGERTRDFAEEAIRATSALFVLARHPVVSINGNSASLAARELAELQKCSEKITLEVNLFHHSEERSHRIAEALREAGATRVLESAAPDAVILEDIQHSRKRMHKDGIAIADVVLVALEDGDRCQALVDSGRKVVSIDLNPLSRTAQATQVTIVDELTRAIPFLTRCIIEDMKISPDVLAKRVEVYDNRAMLERATKAIRGSV